MKLKLAIFLSALSFLSRLLAWSIYNPDLTPEVQDYVFDIMAISELSFVFSGFILTYLISPYSKLVAILRAVFRVTTFAAMYATGKELAGLNTTDTPLETLLFCFLILGVGYYSLRKIHKWEKVTEV